MAMVVRSNMMAYNANRQLGMNNSAVSKNLEKLSSGFKINRAADDAAGLAISEKMKAQIKGLETASANSQDGISLVQTAEGALTEVHDMLNRMTELATKSANGTIQDDVDRDAIQAEVDKLNDEIDRISQSTNFNGINLLDGSLQGKGGRAAKVTATLNGAAVASGAVAGSKAEAEVTLIAGAAKDAYTVELEMTIDGEVKKFSFSGKAAGATMGTEADLKAALEKFVGDKYTVTGAAQAFTFTAKENGSDKSISVNKVTQTINGAVKAPTISATPTAGTDDAISMKLATATGVATDNNVLEIDGQKFQILKQGEKVTVADAKALYTDDGKVAAGGTQRDAIVSQLKDYGIDVRANATDDQTIDIIKAGSNSSDKGGLTLQIGDTGDNFNQVTVSVGNMNAKGIGTKGLDVSTQDAAKAAIKTIKNGINYVSTNRSEMGALQNRLEHTINNLDVAAENMTNANSRIRDTDMAKQMMEYTKMNVLTQSAQAMLAQANQNPQSILQLLQ